MDYYFAATSDEAALKARDLPAGPTPDSLFASAEAKYVMACPHLELLVAAATGKSEPTLVPQLVTLWPDPMLTRLPDQLRDDLSKIEVNALVAEKWAGELWGYEPGDAARVAADVVRVAKAARDAGQPLYWWSEL